MKRTALLMLAALGVTAIAAQPTSSAPQGAAPTASLGPTYNPTQSFAPLVEQVGQAVAAVEVRGKADPRAQAMFRQFGLDPRQFDGELPGRSGEGSGFVISPDGLMLTNHHVIQGAQEVTVTFTDGTEVPVEVLGSDRSMDIALLQPSDPLSGTLIPEEIKAGESFKAKLTVPHHPLFVGVSHVKPRMFRGVEAGTYGAAAGEVDGKWRIGLEKSEDGSCPEFKKKDHEKPTK